MAKINEGVIVLSVPQSGMMIKKISYFPIPSKFCIEVYFFQLSKCLPVPLIDFFVIISIALMWIISDIIKVLSRQFKSFLQKQTSVSIQQL